MKTAPLTCSELLVLGLVAEMPRHGYELEQVIVQRGMREWTQIGFSSIYFVLGQLEKKGLVVAGKPASSKAKKSFSITGSGRTTLAAETLASFANVRVSSSPLVMGMLHWPVLSRSEGHEALRNRRKLVRQELERLEAIQFDQQPQPDYVDALFDFTIHQLRAEETWIAKTLAYMKNKPEPR